MRQAESNLNRRDWLPFTNWILRWMCVCVCMCSPRMTPQSCFVHFRIQFFSPDRAMSMSHEFTCPPVIINYYFRILCSQIPSNKWHSINVPLTVVDRRICWDLRRFVRPTAQTLFRVKCAPIHITSTWTVLLLTLFRKIEWLLLVYRMQFDWIIFSLSLSSRSHVIDVECKWFSTIKKLSSMPQLLRLVCAIEKIERKKGEQKTIECVAVCWVLQHLSNPTRFYPLSFPSQ